MKRKMMKTKKGKGKFPDFLKKQMDTPQGPGQNRPYSSPSPVSKKKNPRGK